MIRLGYVGVNTLLPSASQTFRIRNYSEEKMLEVSYSNIIALKNILRWNLEHKIMIFRISSDLIPYGSNPINSGSWKEVFKFELKEIGNFIKKNGMKVTMHPGQYTVLNTPNENYYRNTLNDLYYHNSVLELLGLDNSHRIVIHGGGSYGAKEYSLEVLKKRFSALPDRIKSRITFENDERCFNARDILSICQELGVSATLDIFHHEVFPSFEELGDRDILLLFRETWFNERQDIHYSNQDQLKKRGAHSESVDLSQFEKFYNAIKDLDLDIMLEVKDKQASVLKIRQAFPELR
jgi:UV DNA damage endonuclease